jgi:N-acetylneuraminic acid mutarotase
MPRAVTSFGATVSDGRLYVLGGYDGEPHSYTQSGQSGELWSLDLVGENGWEPLSEIEGVQGLALVAYQGRVCRIGGMHVGEPGQVRSIDEFACFDLASRQWQAGPSLPAPRSSHDAVMVGSTVFVVGGWKLEGEMQSGTFHDRMLAFDFENPGAGWREIPTPFQRRGLAVSAVDQRLIVIGGLDSGRQVSRQVDIFDIASQQWERGPDYPADSFGVAAETVGGKVYASARDGIVYGLDLGQSRWESIGSLAFPRFFHQLVARGENELLAVGGIRGMGDFPRTQHIESMAVTSRPESSEVVITTAYPGRAKNRQGMFLHEDALYIFGGNTSLEQHDFEPENFVAEHHRFDLPSMTWSRAADFPFARQTIQTVIPADSSFGIAVGGFGHDGTVARTHPESFLYSFADDRWTAWAPLPVARSQFGLALENDRVWVFGGLDYDPTRPENDAFRHLTTILNAPVSGENPAFETVPVEMRGPRRAFAGISHQGRYYVFGGMAGEFALVSDCFSFDLTTLEWAPAACPSKTRLNPQIVAVNDQFYLLGGTSSGDNGLEAERMIEVYDPAADRWSVHERQLPLEPRHLRAFAYRGRILLFSTHDAEPVARVALIEP